VDTFLQAGVNARSLGESVEMWASRRPTHSYHYELFLEDVLTADLDFALIFSGLWEIVGKLHP
jgi:hypothetical protein